MRITIFGAGAVGCYIGGCLAATGARVVFVGRPRLHEEVAAHGLHLSDCRGHAKRLAEVEFATDAQAAQGSDLVLVCVKSSDTVAAAQALRAHVSAETVVVSFQNGIHNAQTLTEHLQRPVLAGMVGFNVAAQGDGRFHQGTQGDLHSQSDPGLVPFAPLFTRAGLPLIQHADLRPVLWAKLMLNLNNAVNALANIPLRAQLSQRGFRECLALAQSEMLSLIASAAMPPLARLSPLPATWIPSILRLPDPIFRVVAGSMLRIDPVARSSMSDDLALGRAPEVDWLNGEVVRLAESQGRVAPINRALCTLIHEAAKSDPRPRWTAQDLRATLLQSHLTGGR